MLYEIIVREKLNEYQNILVLFEIYLEILIEIKIENLKIHRL